MTKGTCSQSESKKRDIFKSKGKEPTNKREDTSQSVKLGINWAGNSPLCLLKIGKLKVRALVDAGADVSVLQVVKCDTLHLVRSAELENRLYQFNAQIILWLTSNENREQLHSSGWWYTYWSFSKVEQNAMKMQCSYTCHTCNIMKHCRIYVKICH